MEFRRFVVIVAAGSGSRLGLGVPKAFAALGDKSLLQRSAEVFESPMLHVQGGVLVVPEGFETTTTEHLPIKRNVAWGIVRGADTRAGSVLCGLQALNEMFKLGAESVVAIHDAARCLLQAELAERCFLAAEQHGASSAAMPVTDTMRRVVENSFQETVARKDLFAMQTPQVFRFDIVLKAHQSVGAIEATDDVELVQQFCAVKLVPGDSRNFKITTASDLELAEKLIN